MNSNTPNENMVLYSLLYFKNTREKIISKVNSEDFTYPNNERFDQLLKAINNNTIDTFDYQHKFIMANEELQSVSGTEWEKALNEMINKAVRRKINGQLMVASALINDPLSSIGEISESLQEIHITSQDSRLYNKPLKTSKDLMMAAMDKLEKIGSGEFTYNSWGIERLDEIAKTTGGDLNIVAGRPGTGKSIFAHNALLNAAKIHPVGYFCSEMQMDMIGLRMIAAHSGITLEKLKNRDMSAGEMQTMMKSTQAIESLKNNMYITTGENPKGDRVENIITWIENIVKKHDVKHVFIDYLQRIAATNPRLPRREQIIHIAHSLKTCAQRLNITITALAQLNRAAVNERPGVHHLAESGYLEQEASVIVLLDRLNPGESAKDRHYIARKPGTEGETINLTEKHLKDKIVFLVAKNRNGERAIMFNDIDMPRLKIGGKATFYDY